MHIIQKILTTPIYGALFRKLTMEGSTESEAIDYVKRAGFFEEGYLELEMLDQVQDINCTPIHFLSPYDREKKNCVLVTTGAFAPIHEGHIDGMEIADRYMRHKGYNVRGGYFAPDHDSYIEEKTKGDKQYAYYKRIEVILETLRYNKWLTVDPWACTYLSHDVNFTLILSRLQHLLKLADGEGESTEIVFVCGSDRASFSMAFEASPEIKCVIVPRPRPGMHFVNELAPYISDNVFIPYEHSASVSSTDIRSNNYRMPEKRRKVIIRGVHESSKLERAIVDLIAPHFDEVTYVNAFEQQTSMASFKDANVISMDPLIAMKYNVGISRLFDNGGFHKLGYVTRPGYRDMEQVVKEIPFGNYVLFDDDCWTGGGTFQTVKGMVELDPDRRVLGNMSLINFSKEVEVIDVRDFIYDDFNGGLVMRSGEQYKRFPYIYPYVDPYIHSSIDEPMQFSMDVWMANGLYNTDEEKQDHCMGMYNLLRRIQRG